MRAIENHINAVIKINVAKWPICGLGGLHICMKFYISEAFYLFESTEHWGKLSCHLVSSIFPRNGVWIKPRFSEHGMSSSGYPGG